MTISTKTIGPMKLDRDGDWFLKTYRCFLCGKVLQEWFNIPDSAERLWVTLTKLRPRHKDAIRVRWDRAGNTRLDDDLDADYFIVDTMRYQAADFGSDFYATIYYE